MAAPDGIRKARSADPWRDTDVIDARAPRFNQGVVAVFALGGVVLGWPVLWALMAVPVKRDLRERPDLARKYGIAVVPTVLAVAADGEVLERLAP